MTSLDDSSKISEIDKKIQTIVRSKGSNRENQIRDLFVSNLDLIIRYIEKKYNIIVGRNIHDLFLNFTAYDSVRYALDNRSVTPLLVDTLVSSFIREITNSVSDHWPSDTIVKVMNNGDFLGYNYEKPTGEILALKLNKSISKITLDRLNVYRDGKFKLLTQLSDISYLVIPL